MLQQAEPDDYVLATGRDAFSVRDFAERAFAQVGVGLAWEASAPRRRVSIGEPAAS